MFNRIIVGVDGSPMSMKALELASGLAQSEHASMTVAHVDERSVGRSGVHDRADEGERLETLREAVAKIEASGVDIGLEITSTLTGDPAPRLCEIAEEKGADLIIVGARGHSRLARGALGGVARRLLSTARMPVMVLPEVAVEAQEQDVAQAETAS